MAYNQQQDPRRAPPQRQYTGPPQGQRAPGRDRDPYNGQAWRNETHDQYDDANGVGSRGYDQYGGNPYAAPPSFSAPQQNNDGRSNTMPSRVKQYNDYDTGYEGKDPYNPEVGMQRRGPPNYQRNPQGIAPMYSRPQGPPDEWQGQQRPPRMPGGGPQMSRGGLPMQGRMQPPRDPGTRGSNDPYAQASPNRSRPMQNPNDGSRQRHEQSPRRQLPDPYSSREQGSRPGPNSGRPEMRAPPQNMRGPDQQYSQPPRERVPPNTRPFEEPKSPQQRNYDNPFPVFSSAKQVGQPNGRMQEEPPIATDAGRYSQEIYNGIVGDYMNDDWQSDRPEDRSDNQLGRSLPTNSAPLQQHRPPTSAEYQPTQRPVQNQNPVFDNTGFSPPSSNQQRNPQPDFRAPAKLSDWNDNIPPMRQGPGPQSSLPFRPGTAPSGQAPANGWSYPGEGNPRMPDRNERPPQERNMSDPSAQFVEDVPAYANVNANVGGHPLAPVRSNGRSGSDASQQRPPRDMSNPNNGYPNAGPQQPHPAYRQFQGQGPGIMPRNPGPDGNYRSSPSRPVDSNFPKFEGPNAEARFLAQPQNHPAHRPFGNEGQPAVSSPRFANAQMAPRPQSPMGQPAPPYPTGLPIPAPGAPIVPYGQGGAFSQSFEQLPRPSIDRGDSSSTNVLRTKRSAAHLPNRANVERPTFYQATGNITHSPTISLASLSKGRQSPLAHAHVDTSRQLPRPPQAQGQNNPDTLPYHATPLRPDGQPDQFPVQPPSRPPPIRQYQKEPAPPPNTASHGRKPSIPVSQEELSRLREIVRTQPSDMKAQLVLAKKLGQAARPSTDGAGVGGLKLNPRDQERYNTEALKLVKKLVSADNSDAMFYLAECYGDGTLGLRNDPKEAFNHYQSAAKLSHASAAYRTAVCCEIGPEEGGGTRKDLVKSFQWYKRASALGDVPAMYKMGIILQKGLLGQEKSLGEAVGYLKRAAERADEENPHALHELGLLYESPKNPGLIVRDEAQAFSLFTRAAKLGYKFSQFKLGQSYEYGLLGCHVDARNSIIWYTKAAAQGEHQSELALSGWYLTGSEGILEHSDTEAYLWARKAALAEPPLPKAMFAMGYFTEVGIGCPRSLEEAKRWYGRAAAYKFPKAQEHLEELQKGGGKVQKNREKLSRSNPKQEGDCTIM